jgi:putative DNA primase/helicase
MSWVNYDDVIAQLRAGGLVIDGGIEVDTPRPVRCYEEGGDREKRGWYWLTTFETGGVRYITGAYGVFHGTDPGKRKIEIRRGNGAPQLTKEERDAIAARHKANMARLKAMREAEAERAASQALKVWRRYEPTGRSGYLERKGVGAHGVRFAPGADTIAVPMMDASGKLWGIQIIRGKDRGKKLEKQYWPRGVMTQGHYHLIGPPPRAGQVVLIAEGYATAATLYEATGLPTVVAFDAGNLRPVALAIRKAYPKARLLVCADDDYLTPDNPGITAAKAAAFAAEGEWVAPVFATERPRDRKGPTDFNDLMLAEGRHVVRAQIEARLRELGWSLSDGAGGDTVDEGAGEGIPSMLQIDEAVERYVMIYGGRGMLFDRVEHILVPKQDVVDMLPDHGWRLFRERKQVVRLDEVGFDPAGTDPKVKCNLWGGWPTKPKPGSCEKLLELLQYLCAGEPYGNRVYEWVLKWLALPIQKPGAKMRTALVFHGPQGTGKNLFFEAYMAIYGEYGRIIDQNAIEDKFNDWASRKLFLIADEVVARQELFHTKNKLKSFITSEWIRINPKNVAAHDERNHVNIVFLSNEAQPVVLEEDDRRFVVIRTPEKVDATFYREVRDEINQGGIEALHHYLLHLDLGDFDEHAPPPLTMAKRDLIALSMSSVKRFIHDWKNGEIVFRDDVVLPFGPAPSAALYRAYQAWCRQMGELKPRPENQFAGEIVMLPGWAKGHRERRRSFQLTETVRQRFIVPADRDIVEASSKGAHALPREPGETLTDWHTRCFFRFMDALGDAP